MQGEPRSDWRSSLGGPDVRRRRFSSSPPTLLLHILSSHDDRPHESPAKNTTTTSTVSVGVGIDINDYTSGVVEEGETGEALAEAEAKARQPAMPCVYDASPPGSPPQCELTTSSTTMTTVTPAGINDGEASITHHTTSHDDAVLSNHDAMAIDGDTSARPLPPAGSLLLSGGMVKAAVPSTTASATTIAATTVVNAPSSILSTRSTAPASSRLSSASASTTSSTTSSTTTSSTTTSTLAARTPPLAPINTAPLANGVMRMRHSTSPMPARYMQRKLSLLAGLKHARGVAHDAASERRRSDNNIYGEPRRAASALNSADGATQSAGAVWRRSSSETIESSPLVRLATEEGARHTALLPSAHHWSLLGSDDGGSPTDIYTPRSVLASSARHSAPAASPSMSDSALPLSSSTAPPPLSSFSAPPPSPSTAPPPLSSFSAPPPSPSSPLSIDHHPRAIPAADLCQSPPSQSTLSDHLSLAFQGLSPRTAPQNGAPAYNVRQSPAYGSSQPSMRSPEPTSPLAFDNEIDRMDEDRLDGYGAARGIHAQDGDIDPATLWMSMAREQPRRLPAASNAELWRLYRRTASSSSATHSLKRRDSMSIHGYGEMFGSFVGGFEESMLTGRLSTPPSKPIQFICEIGAMARTKCRPSLRCPPHVTIPFPAFFYEWREHADGGGRRRDEQGRVTTVSDGATWSTPYVGTVDLEWGLGPLNGHGYHGNDHSTTTPTLPKHRSLSDPPGAFRLARKGQLQLLIKNPSRTVVKVFLVPYDLRTMEPWTRVVLRQKIYARDRQQQGGDGDSAGGDGNLCYALHLQFLCVPSTLAASTVLPAADNDDADAMDDVDSPLSPASTVDSSNNDQLPSSATPRPATHRYYLYKSIRVVFSHRVPDGKEKLKVVTEQVAADVMKHTPTTSHNLAAVDTADEDDHDEDRFGFGTLR